MRDEIIKVNKTGMVLVAAVFLMVILLVVESGFGIVSAVQEFSGENREMFSSNTQFYSPGTYESFSQTYAHTYWPALADREKCEATTDFLMVIRPGGCNPKVVRSDLLEEQNVPVFCKVDIIKINPLLDISKLKSVKFSGEHGKYVAGISFHPDSEAIRSQKGFLDKPLINDAGYVVVVLKRIPREEDMPDSVKVNLTGVLRYDAEGFFGAGKNNYYLQVLNDETWTIGDTYKEDSFFKGRGYLRADWIEADRAKISIYQDKDTRMTSFTLNKGETSGVYYMPGFYCRAGVKVKLQDIEAGVKRVLLEIEDNREWLVEGESFLDNKCRISTITVNNNTGERSVKVNCGGKSEILRYYEKKEAEGEKKELTDKDVEDLVSHYFGKAENYAEEIDAYYGAVEDPESGRIWAAKALYLLGVLAENIGKHATAVEIFNKVIDKYPGSVFADSARLKLDSVGSDSVSYKNYNIKLISIETPSRTDASADFSVTKTNDKLENTEKIQEEETFAKGRFKLLRLYPDKVYLEYFSEGEEDREDRGRFYLSFEDRTTQKGNYVISLDDIHLKQFAKVSVISEIKDFAEAPFSFEIGIEKRAIELSPKKTKELITNLNESIKEWGDIIDRLGKVVKGMKAACFATSAILIVKNFFSNLGGGATARQAVMPQWYKECERKVGKDRAAFNKCLKDNETDIAKDIQIYQRKLEALNTEIIAVQKANLYPRTESVNREKAKEDFLNNNPQFNSDVPWEYEIYNANTKEFDKHSVEVTAEQFKQASLTSLRDWKLYQSIIDDPDSSETAKREAKVKMGEIAGRLSQITPDKGLYTGKDVKWVDSFEAKFFRAGENKGRIYLAPIPKFYKAENGEDVSGFYVVVEDKKIGVEGGYTEAGDIKEFWIQNMGDNKHKDVEQDTKILINYQNVYAGIRKEIDPWDLGKGEFDRLVQDAINVIKTSNRNYGKTKFVLFGQNVVVDMSGKIDEVRCQDFMSPQDCSILFNVCDPVICPASRCDLGGALRVDNVIQSGIIGSIALCLPNAGEVLVPICISGIHAGLEAYVSILKSYRGCLQESLDTGRTIGVCDEIHSIYLCEFFWRQIGPFLDILLIKMVEATYEQGMKGGGEYLTVQDAWQQASQSIDFLRDDYAVNSYRAFQARSWGDVGTEFCKVFVSTKYPSNKDFFDSLIEPDSPVQFHAWFDEIKFTEATVPATSQYKVFYHIWAGKDTGANYQVYLKSPAESAYVQVQDSVLVDTGFVPRGGYVSETRDFTAPAGYKELCVRINGKDECGFKKVSTAFALNYMSDKYYEEQTSMENIVTEEQCISGSPSAYSLLTPNIQEGVQDYIAPSLDKKGVVRICSTENPGGSTDSERWRQVGSCDSESVKCWLDLQSVEEVIKNKDISSTVVSDVGKISEEVDKEIVDAQKSQETLDNAKEAVGKIEGEIERITALAGKQERRTALIAILNTENSGIVNGISIKKTIEELEKIQNSEGFNVTQNMKAEAAYHKFYIYYVLTDALNNAGEGMTKAEGEVPLEMPEEEYGYEFDEEAEETREEKLTLEQVRIKWNENMLEKDVPIFIKKNSFGSEEKYKYTDHGWAPSAGMHFDYVEGIINLVKITQLAGGYIKIGDEKISNYGNSNAEMAEKVFEKLKKPEEEIKEEPSPGALGEGDIA